MYSMVQMKRIFCAWVSLCAAWLGLSAAPAHAQTCAAAMTQGTAPVGWETYCWLDFSAYSDIRARSGAGQNFAFNLNDGSILSFNLRVTPTNQTAFSDVDAPSWTDTAVGNTAFLGIPGRPVLYTLTSGSRSIVFSGINITPPPGASAVTAFAFVAADAEATNESENLQFVTNGSGWKILDQVDPISGNLYPSITGAGTNTFTETGVPGIVGGYIVGTNSPTTVTVNMHAGGLQGAMFAVRFASIRLRKTIAGARVDPADQFNFRVKATSSGAALASGTTTGTHNGPFAATPLSLASDISLTLSETMTAGSVSALTKYQSRLTCINATGGSATPLPDNVLTTNYVFGALQFGDAVICVFNNAAIPHLRIRKALGTNRRFSTDQFIVRINDGSTVEASSTTTGNNSAVGGGDTGLVQLSAGSSYTLDEVMSGPGSLTQYNATLACTNATNGVTSVFPVMVPGNITPVLGDIISCIITNTRVNANATLLVSKTSEVLSDGVSSSNPKAIAGARVRYTVTLQNTGSLAVDANSVIITDPFPTNFTLDASTPIAMNVGTSGLAAFNQGAMVTYSTEASGGAPFGAPLGTGYNGALTGLRFQPSGTMAAATSAGPSTFSFSFTGQID